ncbi:MAG TPA: DNA-directed DNA polymerase II small subunit [Candidatus Bathyarchaeota archaeon]|nr:DNA-directed DNA polymerase II small subunit [Candidatus Bathyarchaeota archaeon]
MKENALKECIKFALENGYQITDDAFKLLIELSKIRNPLEVLREVIADIRTFKSNSFIIGREAIEKFIEKQNSLESVPLIAKDLEEASYFHVEEIKPRIEVLEDPTGKIKTSGTVEDYVKYFVNRFRKIERILRSRSDFKDAIPISEAFKLPVKSRVKTIGMITEKRGKKSHIDLIIEDLKGEARVTVTSNSKREVLEKAEKVMLDQVIGIEAVKLSEDFFKVEDIIFPELPNRRPNSSDDEVYVILMSDLHVGSKEFMDKEFNEFLSWLNLKNGNEFSKEIARKVKYLVIAGDLIDGVGVYPNQEKDLEIPDIYDQYAEVARLLSKVPKHIPIIVIPGNHDASRKSLPQPAIPKEYATKLYELENLYSLGNPSIVRLHGVEFLIYHGRSLDDVISSVPKLSFTQPEQAMKLLLQVRHLAPIYGGKTPIAPEEIDHLVIERIPDVFHAGHVHVNGSCRYRGTLIINSGTWQRQTEYQKMMGLNPTPGVVTLLNLKTFQTITMNFSQS